MHHEIENQPNEIETEAADLGGIHRWKYLSCSDIRWQWNELEAENVFGFNLVRRKVNF